MDLTQVGLPVLFTDPWWLAAFALLPPLIVLGLWEGRTVRRRRVALGVAHASSERWRARAGAILRAAVLACVLLALAGAQLVRSAGPISTVYLVDVSDSMSAADRAAAHAYVQRALDAAGPDDKNGVVLFALAATVARPLGAAGPLPDFAPNGPSGATDIAGAMRLGLGLLPAEGARRIVLISDGLETTGKAADTARQAADAGVPVSVVPLHTGAGNEVAVDSAAAPGSVPVGQKFDVKVRVTSTVAEGASIRLFEDGTLLAEREVALVRGGNEFTFLVTAHDEGFHSYRAQVAAVDDRWAQNNEATAVTVVQSAPRVLIVAGSPDDGKPLQAALAAAQVNAKLGEAGDLPDTLDGMAAYDSIVLANVTAGSLGDAKMAALQTYVRDLGRGLVMLGGEGSFGAGGYLNTPVEAALPVSMDVRANQRQADVALALVIDKSGSMGRCHCGNSGVYRSTSVQESGVAKVDIAKQAVLKAAAGLAPTDRISVITFDTQAHALVAMQPMSKLPDLSNLISGITAGGNTNLFSGLRAATDSLEATSAKVKHVILLTDGWSNDIAYDDLIAEMRSHQITLSTIAAGKGASDLLVDLAQKGGGRYYAAEDESTVPQLFLKETSLAVGAYLVEKPIAPILPRAGPIFAGIDTSKLPTLLGYNSATIRSTSELMLATPDGDPLLAGWQYGLGRSVAWTSDMKGRWATNWVQWPQFAQFAAQLTSWTLPRQNTSGVESNVQTVGDQARLSVDLRDPTGAPRDGPTPHARVRGPDGLTTDVVMAEAAPGHYEGTWRADTPGGYQVTVLQPQSLNTNAITSTTGLVVPYPAEYRLDAPPDIGANLLRSLASASGGRELDPTAAVNAPAGTPLPTRVPAWPFLLTLGLLLFPLDVAVRRVTISRVGSKQ
ncbi:MAG: VWA domain-containing protein [Chloroflexia bacterium]